MLYFPDLEHIPNSRYPKYYITQLKSQSPNTKNQDGIFLLYLTKLSITQTAATTRTIEMFAFRTVTIRPIPAINWSATFPTMIDIPEFPAPFAIMPISLLGFDFPATVYTTIFLIRVISNTLIPLLKRRPGRGISSRTIRLPIVLFFPTHLPAPDKP